LQKRFYPEIGITSVEAEKTRAKQPEKIEPKRELLVIVNASLDFELKGLDATHPYLLGRGFTPETIKHFGLGFCSRG
jgi:DNA primase